MKKNYFLLLLAFIGFTFTLQAVSVTLKVIDETGGVVSNPDGENKDMNLYTWLSDNLKAQNPRTPSDWWYPMYNASGVTPNGNLTLEEGVLTWEITIQATEGEYEWNPGAKSLGWNNINPGMVVWEGGNPKFQVAADGTITGITEIVIEAQQQFYEGTMTLLVKVAPGVDNVYVRGLYGDWGTPLGMTYNDTEKAWLYTIDGTKIPVGNIQSYKYYYGTESWDEVEAKEDGSQRGEGEDRTLEYEQDGIVRDEVPRWYGIAASVYDYPSASKAYEISVNDGNLQINGTFNSVQIYSVSGALLESVNISDYYINTGLSQGIYLLRVDNAVEKIMIK